MKHFFTIELLHEYNKGFAEHLSVIPTYSLTQLVKNNRIAFRSQIVSLDYYLECYIKEDESIKNEVDSLSFWVVCNNEAFYNYTELDVNTSFYLPYFYWSNSNIESKKLITKTISDRIGEIDGNSKKLEALNSYLNEAPKNALGIVQIKLKEVVEKEKLVIEFKVKKTIWQYNIILKDEQKDWNYKIEDEKGEWQFKRVTEIEDKIVFQSTEPIPYKKDANSRLKLIWEPESPQFNNQQSMILPFANYAYKMVSEDNKELTPIYIYI